ncbi:Na(+)-translocating NADH-quinone reductase subunit b (na(+)-translocating nqr subunit b) (na(+)-nqr subunit b) [Thermosipho africanus H17ap60334]|jgi:Na+-transporting NADH:ubiquinone oxidoreductase subunit B|uniref:Na(+)-translocating NADH-quinone reductase subunit b (Na(+)-translocating nqr subunit b) (Na(+)-nqr subunit b) n=1 Tax=Thermosipho africanus (strain TCF52B) TaxID=484019 RepID=B7IGR2_THEAB|nr:RnfABCDGE type electron transport complex subunit D [Thermosipho africanus]ACJ75276.1 Na(+)-translocating NADH-quinone reductase subunit b (na(+)-translocating nqr subunit b) (na(+)-nqr subunit b) [Thermosipho africanus TCF52B]EKF50342.1 Na(+)-translocating NADH-quinone reductase subunit b (na(+)-translocating nqr subunit b) (na(+)-nqr subunit b) [Thermosipho africanus H17ap60334]
MALFQKQVMMRRVLYALLPIYIYSFLFYGLRLIWLSIFVFSFGILAEYIFEKRKNKKVSEAVLVTCMLYTLSLPPLTPWWIAVIGIIFGVVFAKEVYGGFGRNVFNPAITGRLFVYIAFPSFMTKGWMLPKLGSLGLDAVTSATPLSLFDSGKLTNLKDLFFGFRAGSFGEGAIFLIFIGAIYLIITKTASWKIIVSTILSAAFLTFMFDLFIPSAPPTLFALLSGSLLFVSVFIATDPITAPKNSKAQYIYGIIIGVSIVLIRTFYKA